MDKETLINKACYLVDLVEDTLTAVEADKPANSLSKYYFTSDYLPEEDTYAIISKAFGKTKLLEIFFNTMEKFYQLENLMRNTKFEKYGRGSDWFQHCNFDEIYYDLPSTFTALFTLAKTELHSKKEN